LNIYTRIRVYWINWRREKNEMRWVCRRQNRGREFVKVDFDVEE
jgi:hypothetical protein